MHNYSKVVIGTITVEDSEAQVQVSIKTCGSWDEKLKMALVFTLLYSLD